MQYESETDGIRVSVEPRYSLAQSEPRDANWVFSYEILMQNDRPEPVQLLFRHWLIHDSVGEDTEVDGEGVVGQQPVLAPGSEHRYSSFCVLRSPLGFMQGHYTFQQEDGTRFRVEVPRFKLEAPLGPPVGDELSQTAN